MSLPFAVPAVSQTRDYSIRGIGAAPCFLYSQSPAGDQALAHQWILGFLSAVSIYDDDMIPQLEMLPGEADFMSSVSEYCERYPQTTIADAAEDIKRQLDATGG